MKIISRLKLRIEPGKASAMPPIGPILGQRGINIMEFCKNFNEKTRGTNSKLKLIVKIFIYKDKNYKFSICQPSSTDIIKESINLKKGAVNPGREKCDTISIKKIRSIAKKKIIDMNATSLNSAIRTIKGIALSLGITILN